MEMRNQKNCIYIGENLRQLRLKHGKTQKEIAKKLGVSFQQVQKYEMGKNRLPIEKLLELKVIYDEPFESFFKGVVLSSDERSLGFPGGAFVSDREQKALMHRMSELPSTGFRHHLFMIIKMILELQATMKQKNEIDIF